MEFNIKNGDKLTRNFSHLNSNLGIKAKGIDQILKKKYGNFIDLKI